MNELTTAIVACPYCGETIELVVDLSAGPQAYVEDCEVCCRPMDVHVRVGAGGTAAVEVRREDE